ncbi:conserved hypothetical protein [Gloeothece citriformis PCC 7424]|uniref:Uncharacterized protein n=1 Tax=Gloeothece citriformis (strain PCC 7424) TaxID=65393 RepID=B7KCP3_GLOC7|nr:hypothetical protein [Gloeothece citriformis]ACK71594.1 conserved hypothetical protein [Gloeothece citriformis PCC 7424]
MASSAPLKGSELIDCARANGEQGIEVAAYRCGYGNDLARFEQQLREAGQHIGVEINGFDDLVNNRQGNEQRGVVIAPDTPSQL